MPESKAKRDWTAANTTYVGLKLNHRTDADILSALEGVESKQGEVKRLLRLALEIERKQNAETDNDTVHSTWR